MKLSDYSSQSSLSGQQLAQQPQVLTIATWEARDFDNGTKIVLSFVEVEETLTLNKTRIDALRSMFGDVNPNELIGKRVMCTGQQLQGGKFNGAWTVIISAVPAPQPQPDNGNPAMVAGEQPKQNDIAF